METFSTLLALCGGNSQWVPLTKTSDVELWCFLWSAPEQSPWWCHQMETFSVLLALCARNSRVTSEFPSQRPVMQSFDVFCDLCLNKCLSKQPRRCWFETPSCSLWLHCDDYLNHASSVFISPLQTNLKEIWIKAPYFSLQKMQLQMLSVTFWPFCLGLNVLNLLWCSSFSWN